MQDHEVWTFDDDDFYEVDRRADQVRFLLRYAILAPSAHNTQPWKFVVTDEGVDVFADPERQLRITDPDNRELVMSLGTSLANLRVAAAHFGYETWLVCPVPGNDHAVASVTLRETCNPDRRLAALFPAIKHRHTNRSEFDREPIAPDTLAALLDFMDEHHESFRIILTRETTLLADLVAAADRLQMDDPKYRAELASWIGSGRDDGMEPAALHLPRPISAIAPMLVKHVDTGTLRALRDRELVEAAAMIVVLTADDDSFSLVRAGHDLELFLLTITGLGLQYSFLNSAAQVPGFRERLTQLSRARRPAQLLIRVGSAEPEKCRTARRPVAKVVVEWKGDRDDNGVRRQKQPGRANTY